MAHTSGRLGGYIYGELNVPRTYFFEWDIREYSNPFGTRNLAFGHPAWVKELGTTIPKAMEFEDMILDYAENSLSGMYQSRVQAFTFGMSTSDFSVSNLRFWRPSGTALQSSGYMEYRASGVWIPYAKIPSGVGIVVPSSLPTLANVRRQDITFGNLDFSEDSHVSEYVYISLTLPSGFGLGLYGLGTNGHLAFRMTYDWYYKFQSSGSMT